MIPPSESRKRAARMETDRSTKTHRLEDNEDALAWQAGEVWGGDIDFDTERFVVQGVHGCPRPAMTAGSAPDHGRRASARPRASIFIFSKQTDLISV